METVVDTIARIKLIVMKDWFIEQPDDAKNPYIKPVRVIAPAYIENVDPTRRACHVLEEVASNFARQVSAHECAKSTKRNRPKRIKNTEPARPK